jgi:precorrin-6A/cobalt-precorrin-6A reductase
LILGGTGDARELARLLMAAGVHTISSLAGVTQQPELPEGDVRIGGFGGAEAMARFVRESGSRAIVNATHPYAAKISATAAEAAQLAGVPLWRLWRPAWQPEAGDRWISAGDTSDAARLLPSGSRPLVTTGRKVTVAFFARQDVQGVLRTIDRVSGEIPSNWTVLMARPPFTLSQEQALIEEKSIDVLVTKNSGGETRAAKLDAARVKGLPVIMVGRPSTPAQAEIWPPRAAADQVIATIMA